MFRNSTISLCSIGYEGATTILDAILNSTFMPHILNVYPSFFQSSMGPLQGSRVKIRGHMIAHRTPLSPRTKTFMFVVDFYVRYFIILRFIHIPHFLFGSSVETNDDVWPGSKQFVIFIVMVTCIQTSWFISAACTYDKQWFQSLKSLRYVVSK